MTDIELKAYIKQTVREALAEGPEQKKQTPRILTPTQQKWFRDESGSSSTSKMGEAFDGKGYKAYQIWDKLRVLAVAIAGKSYVRQIDPEDADKINEIADRLCQCVYEAREDWKKYKQEKT